MRSRNESISSWCSRCHAGAARRLGHRRRRGDRPAGCAARPRGRSRRGGHGILDCWESIPIRASRAPSSKPRGKLTIRPTTRSRCLAAPEEGFRAPNQAEGEHGRQNLEKPQPGLPLLCPPGGGYCRRSPRSLARTEVRRRRLRFSRSIHAPKGPHRARRHGRRSWAVGGGAGGPDRARPSSRQRVHPVRRPSQDRAAVERHPRLAGARLVHTDVAVRMDDKPSQALRNGRWKSSMWLAIDAVKKGEADIAVSAGNTGALMAMAKFHLKTMPGHRPPGDCGDLADHPRPFHRARPRRQHRRRC